MLFFPFCDVYLSFRSNILVCTYFQGDDDRMIRMNIGLFHQLQCKYYI